MSLNIDDLILQLADIEQRLDALLQYRAIISSRQVLDANVPLTPTSISPHSQKVNADLQPNISYIHSPNEETQIVSFEPESLGVVASVNLADTTTLITQNQILVETQVVHPGVVTHDVSQEPSSRDAQTVHPQTEPTPAATENVNVFNAIDEYKPLGQTHQTTQSNEKSSLLRPTQENNHETISLTMVEALASQDISNQTLAVSPQEMERATDNLKTDHVVTSSTLTFGKTIAASEVIPVQVKKVVRVSQEIPNLIPIDGDESAKTRQESLFEDLGEQTEQTTSNLSKVEEETTNAQPHEKIVLYKSSAKPKDRRTHYGPRSQNMTYVTYR